MANYFHDLDLKGNPTPLPMKLPADINQYDQDSDRMASSLNHQKTYLSANVLGNTFMKSPCNPPILDTDGLAYLLEKGTTYNFRLKIPSRQTLSLMTIDISGNYL
ncbi:hypothetical protein AVEN_224992-1 [Araneus ventricosus]|uniref:Uncharacterized protein n=1 Tax=Araneus ventricosus TaxID=182803 RepID=A0A4Y2S7B3_ARAVE|nr:hypothetical protein AVEN_224992-1 [Araneus ventricosus]